MPLCHGEASTFIIGGLIDDTQIASNEYPNVYEGSTRAGNNSLILKMSLNFNSGQNGSNLPKLEFIDEHNKQLMLRNEFPELYNSMLEIGYEHFMFGLGWSADLLIVEDWKVSKRVVRDSGGGQFFA